MRHITSRGTGFIYLFLFAFIAPIFILFGKGTETHPNANTSSYVVIGAFAYQNNAVRFVSSAKEKSLDARFALNPARNLYYVYVFESADVNDALRELYKIRSMSGFADAWVFTGVLGNAPQNKPIAAVEQTVVIKEVEKTPIAVEEEPEEEEEMDEEPEEPKIAEQAIAPTKEIIKPANIEKEKGYHYVYFNTINKQTLKEVEGKVNIIDVERAKQLDQVKAHELTKVKDPNNGTGRVKFASNVFGYREVQHVIDLDQPVNDTTKAYTRVNGDSIIVDFELQRFSRGDVLIMYNVYFFIDAAIMKAESLYELNSFLDMLMENEKLKVRIHGHTNGNSHGKIVHLNPEDKNFFSLKADHKESKGSAKQLSQYRAETIREWLLEQGIKADRIDVKGWGGKKMMFDKHDTQAYKNVRVEVEIIEE